MPRRSAPTLVAAALLLAPLSAARADSPARTPEVIARGKASFARHCVACHGKQGEGDGPAAKALKPKPRNLVTSPLPGGAEAVFQVLTAGKKGTGMIAYRHLPEEERWAIAWFVTSLGEPAGK